MKHVKTKHAQTTGVLERANSTIKASLKMESGEHTKHWRKHLPIAFLNYNTTYHSSIDCEPSRVFHGRVPHKILDHSFGLRFNPNTAPSTDFAEDLLRRIKILHDRTTKNVMQSYIKYKRYYDKNAKASPLKEKDYCFILKPKADHQGSKIPFRDFRWIGPYLVKKVLPSKIYIVRKLNTNKTQILHRIRLRNYNPENSPDDNYQEAQWQIDDNNNNHKMIYITLHEKRNLVDTQLTFLSFILTLTHLILTIVTQRDQTLLLSRAPIFMIQAMVKTGKLAALLSHLWYIPQSLNR